MPTLVQFDAPPKDSPRDALKGIKEAFFDRWRDSPREDPFRDAAYKCVRALEDRITQLERTIRRFLAEALTHVRPAGNACLPAHRPNGCRCISRWPRARARRVSGRRCAMTRQPRSGEVLFS